MEIQKSKNILKIYKEEWNIDNNKINILFNKFNKNSIDINILKIIFSEYNIIGKIDINNKYNLIINKNANKIDKNIKKEYLKIIEKYLMNRKKQNFIKKVKMNDLEIGQNIANVNNLEKEQNKFLETTLGKTINTAVNIGLRWVLPDLIEDEIINIKDSLVKGGLKQGINTAINSAINLGKSAMGIFTGNFENLSQAQEAIKSGGIIDSLSNVLDSVLSKVTKKGWIKYGTSTLIRQGKNVILDNISKSIENSFTNQINNLDKLVKYENNWKAYYKDKNLNGMEKEYRKINEKLKELMPFETALKQARQIENLHKIIKNNGGDFNLTQEQIELSKMLV